MPAEMVILKLEGAVQASQVAGLAGHTFGVGKIASTGNGMQKWLFLNPLDGGSTAPVALKIEGTQQIAKISALSGKTVLVGKAPTVIGGMHNLLVLYPTTGSMAPVAASAAKAGSQAVMLKVEGANQAAQLPMLTGKTFTVMDPPLMGTQAQKWLFLKPAAGSGLADQGMIALKMQHGGAAVTPHLIGKKVLLGNSPIVAGGTSKWIMLTPLTSGTTPSAAALPSAATQHTLGLVVSSQPVMQTVAAKTTTAATPLNTATKSSAAASTVLAKGMGMSLGTGLSLATWGSAVLAVAIGVGVYNYMKRTQGDSQKKGLEEAVS